MVAEGIELPEQLAFLVDRKCAQGQGYLFGRPVPEEEFIRLYQQHSGTFGEAADGTAGDA